MSKAKTFTGRRRQRKTTWRIKFGDTFSRVLITFGGVGTIVAVSTVFVFLLAVVMPLFLPARVSEPNVNPAPSGDDRRPLRIAADEYQVTAYSLHEDGSLVVFRLDTGEVLQEMHLVDDAAITSATFSIESDRVTLGLANGSIRSGTIGFKTSFLSPDDMPESIRALDIGEAAAFDGGMVQITPDRQFRHQKLVASLEEPIQTGSQEPVRLVTRVAQAGGSAIVTLTADQRLRAIKIRRNRNLLTGEVRTRVETALLPYERGDHGEAAFLLASSLGDVILAWRDGTAMRFDTRNIDNPVLVETLDLTPDGAELTAARYILGETTLITGNSRGELTGWFVTSPVVDPLEADPTAQLDVAKAKLTPTKRFAAGDAAVTRIEPSSRSRMFVAGYADGHIRVFQATTENLVTDVTMPAAGSVQAVAITPKDDGLIALAANQLTRWAFDPMHPQVTLRSLFRPVWYDGYNQPTHTWQSSSGSDSFEEKLGLVPLVFGTIKATIYSMIFAVPLAILAAIYTSEFLHPRVKARVKPVVELMASLPSVVLGFLAGLVIAPIVDDVVPGLMACLFTIPLMMLVGAYLWQLLPRPTQLYLQQFGFTDSIRVERPSRVKRAAQVLVERLGGFKLVAMFLMLAIGLWSGLTIGPIVERVLFAGDVKAWLNGQIGSGAGGWFVILLPVSAVISAMISARLINPLLRARATDWTRARMAAISLGKFVAGAFVTVLVAAALASLMNLAWDPRGPIHLGTLDVAPMGTYVQRNAMIVGFVMGFAVIPIIYTIAEDALSAVPEHLRSASLGAGATPWQTAVRIIIPTATSGLFSACMIGLGRAVGETMIVLMAAGNTPVLRANIFEGFRTLSANIAVELPEAVRESTHYRTLFLAALVLFLMTFFVNTIAEAVRLRFRRRNQSL